MEILLLCFVLISIIEFIAWKNKRKELDQYLKKTTEELETQYIQIFKIKHNDLEFKTKQLESKLSERQEELNSLEARIVEKTKFNESMRQWREEELNRLILQEKADKIKLINIEMDAIRTQQKEAAAQELRLLKQKYEEQCEQYQDAFEIQKDDCNAQLQSILNEIAEQKRKRDAANEAILREKEIKEKQTFYKVNLSENDKEDIQLIKSFITSIHNRDALNKLIWDIYIKKPVDQLIKNVLNNDEFSGIYKFTNINNGMVYIGKSTNLKKRVQEHYKSAFDLSTIASSAFHKALKDVGVDNFTYEVLEKCDKEKLTEREKYYINFYESNKYGYNERIG